MHPSIATLLAYQGQDLAPLRAKRIQQHLHHCTRCVNELRQAERGLDMFAALESGAFRSRAEACETDLQAIKARILHRSAVRRAQKATQPEVNRQVVKALSGYLGLGAASLVRDALAISSREPLLATAERLFSAFLGRKAATALLSQIVDGLCPEPSLAVGPPD